MRRNPYPHSGVLDALTGIAWADDSQVTRLTATKRYAALAEQPGVSVWLSSDTYEQDGGYPA